MLGVRWVLVLRPGGRSKSLDRRFDWLTSNLLNRRRAGGTHWGPWQFENLHNHSSRANCPHLEQGLDDRQPRPPRQQPSPLARAPSGRQEVVKGHLQCGVWFGAARRAR